jgi:hypothetical protein
MPSMRNATRETLAIPGRLVQTTLRHIMLDANGLSMWRINEGMGTLLKRIPGKWSSG